MSTDDTAAAIARNVTNLSHALGQHLAHPTPDEPRETRRHRALLVEVHALLAMVQRVPGPADYGPIVRQRLSAATIEAVVEHTAIALQEAESR
jgi:hypothetical protein